MVYGAVRRCAIDAAAVCLRDRRFCATSKGWLAGLLLGVCRSFDSGLGAGRAQFCCHESRNTASRLGGDARTVIRENWRGNPTGQTLGSDAGWSREQDVKAFQSNFAHNCQLRMAPYDVPLMPPTVSLCNAKPALCFSATPRAFAGDGESGPSAKITPLDQSATIAAELPKVRMG
jgi:hypothetical protein